MKEYIKPQLEVREIRVSENLANNVGWAYDKSKGVITVHNNLIALTSVNSPSDSE